MTKKIKLKISARLVKKRFRRQGAGSKKGCRFCSKQDAVLLLDYKNAQFLRGFLTERGKILQSRISGNCSKHQRKLSSMVRKARVMALLPYTSPYF